MLMRYVVKQIRVLYDAIFLFLGALLAAILISEEKSLLDASGVLALLAALTAILDLAFRRTLLWHVRLTEVGAAVMNGEKTERLIPYEAVKEICLMRAFYYNRGAEYTIEKDKRLTGVIVLCGAQRHGDDIRKGKRVQLGLGKESVLPRFAQEWKCLAVLPVDGENLRLLLERTDACVYADENVFESYRAELGGAIKALPDRIVPVTGCRGGMI